MLEPASYRANPNIFDYYHSFTLIDHINGEFIVGGNKENILSANFHYSITGSEEAGYELEFFKLEFDAVCSFYSEAVKNMPEQWKVKFRIVKGTFFFLQELPFEVNEEQQLYMKYNERIVFEKDPLLLFPGQYSGSAFAKQFYENPPSGLQENVFYHTAEFYTKSKAKQYGLI